MKRPFPAHAYSMGPLRRCFWAEAVPGEDLHAPLATGESSADFAVIGGGYTGLNAALALAEAGEDVILLEAEHPGFGASGRNGGFCCLGGSRASDRQLERRGGAAPVRRAEMAAIDHVAALIDSHGWDVDRHSSGEVIVAHTPAKLEALRRDRRGIEADYGIETVLVEAPDMAAHGMSSPRFHGALKVPEGFALHPRKYARALAAAASAAGARLHGQSPVTAIEAEAGGFRLTTPQARIRARRLIVATNGYSSEDVPPWMRARFLPAQSSVIATRPMSEDELAAQGWTTRNMAYEERGLLHYFHLTPEGQMVFGQRDGLISSPANEERLARKVRADFNATFPAWEGVEAPHYWSGMVCLTASLTPFCGAIPEMPGAFAAFGYHGNGVAMGSLCGALVADLARGAEPRHPIPPAFAAAPGRFPLGPLRRGYLAANYAWAVLTDR